jgi:putative copper resistance protein D
LDEALIICRFLHFSAAMLLFGAGTFTEVLAPAGLREWLARSFRRPIIALAIAVGVTTVAWLGLEAGEIGTGWADAISPDTIGSVLSGTNFGQVWIWRLGFAVLLIGALFLKGRRGRLAILALSAALLVSLAFVGHAAEQEGGLGLVHRGNQAIHMLAAGFWIGCLPPLLLSLPKLRDPATRRDAATALRRFSSLGHVAVALLIATGVVNTAFIVGGLPLDFSSPYQLLLTIKIGLVALMVVIAILNRYVAVPRLSRGPLAARSLVVGTLAELAIGTIVIALVSAFATFDPMPGGMG